MENQPLLPQYPYNDPDKVLVRGSEDFIRADKLQNIKRTLNSLAQDVGVELTFTKVAPFISEPDQTMLPPGCIVSAKALHGLFHKKQYDSVRLSDALRKGLSAVHPADVQRTQLGVWVNEGTLLRLADYFANSKEKNDKIMKQEKIIPEALYKRYGVIRALRVQFQNPLLAMASSGRAREMSSI